MYLSIAHVLMNHGVIYPLSISLFDQYAIKHVIYYNIKDMIIQSNVLAHNLCNKYLRKIHLLLRYKSFFHDTI